MLEIFKTVEDSLTTCDTITEGSWISISQPTIQELERVSKKTGIEIDDLKAPLDDEERSRIEVEDDYVMILVDIPSLDEKERYVTIPLGIFMTKVTNPPIISIPNIRITKSLIVVRVCTNMFFISSTL